MNGEGESIKGWSIESNVVPYSDARYIDAKRGDVLVTLNGTKDGILVISPERQVLIPLDVANRLLELAGLVR